MWSMYLKFGACQQFEALLPDDPLPNHFQFPGAIVLASKSSVVQVIKSSYFCARI